MTLLEVAADTVADTSATTPTHQAGDLIVVTAYANGTTTPPTLGPGFVLVVSGGANACSEIVGYRWATGIDDTADPITGWTGATHLHYVIWRGADPLIPIGASAQGGGTGTSAVMPALSLQRTDGTSFAYTSFLHSAATTVGAAPPGMTQLTTQGTAPVSRAYQSTAAVSALTAGSVTVSPTGNYRSVSLEIRSPAKLVAGAWQTHTWYTVTPVNQLPVLELDYAAGQVSPPFEPTEDDESLRNDVTVTRTDGSSGRYILEEGPLSTLPPPDGVGGYQDSVDLNVLSDEQLMDQAAWRVHLGTVDEPRYPSVTVSLTRNPDLAETVGQVESGDRVIIHNPPAWLPPGDIDLIAQGYTETILPNSWEWTANCTPGSPWTVGVVSNDDLDRLDTGGSELTAAITATATTFQVTTTGQAPWVDTAGYPDEFPFDIEVDGEVMTVTGIAGAASPQTFTVVRSVNGVVKAHGGVAAVVNLVTNPSFETNTAGWSGGGGFTSTARSTDFAAFGSQSVKLVPNGTTGFPAIHTANLGAITEGETVTNSGWVYVPDGSTAQVRVRVEWLDSTGAVLDFTQSDAQPGNDDWFRLAATSQAPAGAAGWWLKVAVRGADGTPAPGDVCYVDGLMATRGGEVVDYIDGDQPNCVWDGAAHASTSRRIGWTADSLPSVGLAQPTILGL